MKETQIAAVAKATISAMLLSTLCSGFVLLEVTGMQAPFVWGIALWSAVVAIVGGVIVFAAYLGRAVVETFGLAQERPAAAPPLGMGATA